MDFHSVMETFAEAWVAANTHTPLTVAAEQGLINGPNNHPPSRAVPVHSASSQNSPVQPVPGQPVPGQPLPGQPVLNHPPVAHCNPLNGPANNETAILEPPSSHSPILCTLQDISSERRDIECSSESENCRIPERSSEDSPNNCSNLSEIKSSFITLSKPHGKSLPVHCIVEQIPGPQACGQHVELDSFAIVPCDTLFNDLVRTALGKLGYSTAQILGAKGSIQIKNWKPLAFDQITELPEATVADILGELTTVASLHVRLYSVPDDPKEWKDITVRNAVLELLREMSQSKLAKLCPLSQPMLSNIINNRYMGKIGKEKCQEFGLWYLNYRKQNPEGSTLEVVPSDRPADGRLTFHPTKELPLMRDWFHMCRNPSRRTLQMYVDILNQGPVRQQERPKIAFATLKNWWKNEKQRERKHMRGDEGVDDPGKPKKRKKSNVSQNSENLKDGLNEQSLTSSNADSHDGLKSNNFTLINHSENESDAEKSDKKDFDAMETTTLVSHPDPSRAISNSSLVSKSDSNANMISFSETSGDANKFLQKDFNVNESSKMNLLHPSKVSMDSSMFHKIPVCIDQNHSLFPFSDPHLNVHNCTKMYCDNNPVERTNASDGNSNQVSSEEDVDRIMPSKKSKQFFKYSEEDMTKAIIDVRENKAKLRETARKFNIPHSTLLNKVKGQTPDIRKMGPPTILTPVEELILCNWITANAMKGIPLKRCMLLETVKDIITADGRPNPFHKNKPGRKWFQSFLRRHPEINRNVFHK